MPPAVLVHFRLSTGLLDGYCGDLLRKKTRIEVAALDPGELAARPRAQAAPADEPTERALGALWGELLDVEHVLPGDDWFALGGDSILALQLVARAAEQGMQLTPPELK